MLSRSDGHERTLVHLVRHVARRDLVSCAMAVLRCA